jgi:hypothetical protein
VIYFNNAIINAKTSESTHQVLNSRNPMLTLPQRSGEFGFQHILGLSGYLNTWREINASKHNARIGWRWTQSQ